MSNSKKYLAVFSLVIAFVIIGYLRDFVAININYHLHHIYFETDRSIAHSFFDFLHQYTYMQVYYSKYVMTLIFTLLNFFVGYFLLRVMFHERPLLLIYNGIYAIVILVSAVVFAGGYALGNPDEGYHFSRIFMGFLQSPVPAAILLFGYPLYRKSAQA